MPDNTPAGTPPDDGCTCGATTDGGIRKGHACFCEPADVIDTRPPVGGEDR